MVKIIDGENFKNMMLAAAAAIEEKKQEINELNVFPVPDGDTGTNMSMTLNAAAAELMKFEKPTLGKAVDLTSSALLRGARGNSGVITSLLFRGFGKRLKELGGANAQEFAEALQEGVNTAYKAVMKPTEGTILTVSRLAAEGALKEAASNGEVDEVLSAAITAAREALENTVEQNPVLKKAGVVDAGGAGFLLILQGMLNEVRGEEMPADEEPAQAEKADFGAIPAEDITFAFDTVFIVRKPSPNVNLEPFRTYLNGIGDSLVIGEDDEAFKVHVHTNIPGAALTEAQKYGTLELAKIENMRTQAEDLAAGRHVQSTDDLEAVEEELENQGCAPAQPVKAAPEKEYGYVAVCAGAGLEAVFRDLGVDGIISGGQTMNPSTEDILREIDRTPAHVVYVLPNNKNIIMAAEQCVRLCEDKTVVVLPTKTVPQGIAAMLAVDPDAGREELTQIMTEAAQRVRTAEITYAARDSDFDGFAIKEGDYLALMEHQLFGTDRDLDALLDRLARSEDIQSAEFLSIFYGEDVTEEQAQEAAQKFTDACPNAEVNLLPGGQPVYYYMISAE